MKALLVAAVTLVCVASAVPMRAADPSAADEIDELLAEVEWEDSETLTDFREKIAKVRMASEADQTEKSAKTLAANQPGTVGSSSGFGSTLGDTLTNFLAPLGFSADVIDVADDEKSVTVDINKIFGIKAFKLNATFTEPAADSTLLEQILESDREKQQKAIEEGLDDMSNAAISLTYGFQRRAGVLGSGFKFGVGRQPQLYENFVQAILVSAYNKVNDPTRSSDGCEELLIDAGVTDVDQVHAKTANELRNLLPSTAWEQCQRAVVQTELDDAQLATSLGGFRLSELRHLVENQPQLTFVGGYERRDELVGGDSYSATIKYEMGSRNLNTVRKRMAAGESTLDAYTRVLDSDYLAKDRTSFSLAYRHRLARDVSYSYDQVTVDPATGEENRFPKTATLSAPAADEWCGKVSWSRSFQRQATDVRGEEIAPRLDFSAEYVWVDDDPMRQKRWVAQLVYNLPTAGGFSLPISLSYADKAEFLGDPDHKWSAHFGISYGLPSKSK